MRCGGCEGSSSSNSNSNRNSSGGSSSRSSSSGEESKGGSSARHRSLDRGRVGAGPHQRTPTAAPGCRTRPSRRPRAPPKGQPAHSRAATIVNIFVFLALLICSCPSRSSMLTAAAAATAVKASAGCSTGTQQGQSGTPQGPMAAPWPVCPVDLLNLLDLQRGTLVRSPDAASSARLLMDAASGASMSSTSSSSCATRLQCGLIRAVLPAAAASACPITGATRGDDVGGGSGGAALRSSISTVGRASAAITLTTAAGAVGQRAPLLQRLEALLDLCAPELALFTALQLAAARAAGQQGADAAEGSAQQQQGLVEDVVVMAAALAACPPLTHETIDACLAQGSTSSSSSSSSGSSSNDGAWGLGPAVAPMGAGDQCLPAAAVVSPEIWSLTGAWSQAAPSSSSGAAAGGSLDGISGGVSSAASSSAGGASRGGITWRAGCSCTQDWEPVCDLVTGQQYPNACFASCLGMAQRVGLCSKLVQPACAPSPAPEPSQPEPATAPASSDSSQQPPPEQASSLAAARAVWRSIFSARVRVATAGIGPAVDTEAEAEAEARRLFLARNAEPPLAASTANMAQNDLLASSIAAVFSAVGVVGEPGPSPGALAAAAGAGSAGSATAPAPAATEPLAVLNSLLAELLQPAVELLLASSSSSGALQGAATAGAGESDPAESALARRLHLLYLLSAAAAPDASDQEPAETAVGPEASVAG